jgi:hypothetical protein
MGPNCPTFLYKTLFLFNCPAPLLGTKNHPNALLLLMFFSGGTIEGQHPTFSSGPTEHSVDAHRAEFSTGAPMRFAHRRRRSSVSSIANIRLPEPTPSTRYRRRYRFHQQVPFVSFAAERLAAGLSRTCVFAVAINPSAVEDEADLSIPLMKLAVMTRSGPRAEPGGKRSSTSFAGTPLKRGIWSLSLPFGSYIFRPSFRVFCPAVREPLIRFYWPF